MYIKSILISCSALVFATNLFAANMCVKNDMVMIVLDPGVGATGDNYHSYDANTQTWETRFSYGTVSGISGCSTLAGTNMGDVASNQSAISQVTTGQYCYCKMLRPVLSPWVFRYVNSSAGSCATLCANLCANLVGYDVALRRGLFTNAGI